MYHSIVDTVEDGAQVVATMAIPIWKHAVIFLTSVVAFVALDMTWIWLVAGEIYLTVLGDILRQPDPLAGILAWFCIVGAVYYFALPSSRGSPVLALRQVREKAWSANWFRCRPCVVRMAHEPLGTSYQRNQNMAHELVGTPYQRPFLTRTVLCCIYCFREH